MKAIVITRNGPPDGLELQEVPKPVPGDDEVLIRVHAATVTIGDVIMRRMGFPLTLLMRLFGFRNKRIPGHELAGVVEAVGSEVTRFSVGDQVFGTTTGRATGANAEYVCLPERWSKGVLAVKPAGVTFEAAAAVPVGGMTALQLLGKADIQPGHKVLVYGASGSVGSYAAQLARHQGARVTGVSSGANLELVRSLGADAVIDYTQEDVTAGNERYHVVFDAVGKLAAAKAKSALEAGGRFLTVRSLTSEKTEDLIRLGELLEAGAIRAIIDRHYPLAEVPEAHRYVETGRKRGNVVITVVAGTARADEQS